jgi:hypothetical protein
MCNLTNSYLRSCILYYSTAAISAKRASATSNLHSFRCAAAFLATVFTRHKQTVFHILCCSLPSSRLSAGLRRLLAKYIPALLGVQSTVWGDSHMLPSRGVRVWVVYLTPKIERIIVLLSASQRVRRGCRCRKVWLTRNDYYYYYILCCCSALSF